MVRKFADYLFSPVGAWPLVVFRFTLIFALALHFLPSVFNHRDNYGANSIRFPVMLPELGEFLLHIPGSMQITHLLFIGALAGAVSLCATRFFFAIIVVCMYFYLSVNALNTNTLGVWPTLNICTLFALLPSGNARFFFRRGAFPGIQFGETPRLLPLLILIQIFGAFFFAGIEKLLAGWHMADSMKDFLNLPPGSIVRPWVYKVFPSGAPGVISTSLTLLTFTGELLLPVLLFFRKFRGLTILAYQIFFLGVMAVLDIPPLFYLVFAGGGILALRI